MLLHGLLHNLHVARVLGLLQRRQGWSWRGFCGGEDMTLLTDYCIPELGGIGLGRERPGRPRCARAATLLPMVGSPRAHRARVRSDGGGAVAAILALDVIAHELLPVKCLDILPRRAGGKKTRLRQHGKHLPVGINRVVAGPTAKRPALAEHSPIFGAILNEWDGHDERAYKRHRAHGHRPPSARAHCDRRPRTPGLVCS